MASGTGPSTSYCIFQHEIKCMMYTFGDCQSPSLESAALIEELTHQQMCELTVRAAEVTTMRGAKFMSVEDVLFLLRKDRDKLKRLMRHLNYKEIAKKAQSQSKSEEEEPGDYEVFRQPPTTGSKKRKISLDFMGSIGDLAGDRGMFGQEEVDEIQQERIERQDTITRNMDPAQYMEYSECRQASFHKNTTRFKEWLDIGSLIDLKPNQDIVEVFGYLAFETVRELVELSLMVKQDMESASLDPSSNPHLSLPPSTPSQFGTTHTFISTPANNSNTASSPPSSPTSPLGQVGSPQASSGSRTPKTKKRRQKSTATVPQVLAEKRSNGIQPMHVREALRRYNTMIGPLTPLSTHFSRPSFTKRTFCL